MTALHSARLILSEIEGWSIGGSFEETLKKLTDAMASIDYDETLKACKEAVSKGVPLAKVFGALSEGIARANYNRP